MYRKQLDACVWMHVLALTGMADIMDRTAKEQLGQDLCGNVPEFSEEAARSVFEALLGDEGEHGSPHPRKADGFRSIKGSGKPIWHVNDP